MSNRDDKNTRKRKASIITDFDDDLDADKKEKRKIGTYLPEQSLDQPPESISAGMLNSSEFDYKNLVLKKSKLRGFKQSVWLGIFLIMIMLFWNIYVAFKSVMTNNLFLGYGLILILIVFLTYLLSITISYVTEKSNYKYLH